MMERFYRVQGKDASQFAVDRESGLFLLDAPPWSGGRQTGERISHPVTDMLYPVQPSKIVCVGLNYELHVQESASRATVPEEPILFLKPPSALLSPGKEILLPDGVGRVDHEAEVALVMGREIHGATVAEARRAIFGVTALNDVTAREIQRKDGQWTRAKGFDRFCPVGPCVVTGVDPDALELSARVNGETRQSGTTQDFLFSSGELVSFISRVMTLLPGDLVSTGTPAGVSALHDGDLVEVEVEHVGVLANPVRASLART